MKNKGRKVGKSALAAALSLSMSLSGLALPAATTVLADDVTPLKTLDFNEGLAEFVYDAEKGTGDANYEIKKSIEVRYTKVGDQVETGKDLTDANGLVYTGNGKDAKYSKTVFSNQPSTSTDDVKGTALTLDKTVKAEEIVKTKSAAIEGDDEATAALDTGSETYDITENGVAIGAVASPATTSRSQVYFSNPFYNQTADAYTLTYWQYVPEGTTTDAALIAFEGTAAGKEADATGAIALYYDADSASTTAGEWQQIAVVFTASGATFYVNGKAVSDSYMTTVGDYALSTITSSERILFGGSDLVGMDTIYNSKLDDVTFYAAALTAEQIASDYEAAAAKLSPSVDVDNPLAYYSLSDTAQFTDIGTSTSVEIVDATVAGKSVKVAHVAKNSATTTQVGLALTENPFANVDSLEGITIGYWFKSALGTRGANKGKVGDYKSLVIADEAKFINNLKNTEQTGTGRSWIYVDNSLTTSFQEGSDYQVGKWLKNTYKFTLGEEAAEALKTLEGSGTGQSEWFYVTLVATNAGIQMYVNGERYENEEADVYGARFGDGYYALANEQDDPITKYGIVGGTNNQMATQLLTFVGYADTKLYFGWSPSDLSAGSYQASAESWVYSVSCYDGAMSDEEVAALYAKETGAGDVVYGDLNGDGNVKVEDALAVLRYVVGLDELTETQKTAANVDGEDGIKVGDALCILKHVVGLMPTFPVEQ